MLKIKDKNPVATSVLDEQSFVEFCQEPKFKLKAWGLEEDRDRGGGKQHYKTFSSLPLRTISLSSLPGWYNGLKSEMTTALWNDCALSSLWCQNETQAAAAWA